jgi:2-succinyl-5-enolpyruvyl-6-hydroxy-3-cyclohexene-1-carboxylate synthase
MLVAHADAILRTETSRRLQPEVVLRLGEPPASKVVSTWLAQLPATHIVVSSSVAVHDPDRVVKRQFLSEIETFISQIVSEPAPDEWSATWRNVSRCADKALDWELEKPGELNEPRAARVVAENLSSESTLVVSSSMPIREAVPSSSDAKASSPPRLPISRLQLSTSLCQSRSRQSRCKNRPLFCWHL